MPRKIRKAKQELRNSENLSEDHQKAALRRVTALESQQRVLSMISEHRRTMKPFRDATPHAVRKRNAFFDALKAAIQKRDAA